MTHHVLIRIAAERVDNHNFTKYIVLGDDVVICSREVAISYKRLMTELGIQISIAKSIVPCEKENLFSVEFASKLIRNGIDVSPFPLGLLLEGRVTSKIQLMSSLLKSRCSMYEREESSNTKVNIPPRELNLWSGPFAEVVFGDSLLFSRASVCEHLFCKEKYVNTQESWVSF